MAMVGRLVLLSGMVLGITSQAEVKPPNVSGLRLHLDAGDAGAVVRSGNDVLEWRDSEHGAIRFTVGGGQPVFVEDAVNGRPAIRFDQAYFETEAPEALNMTAGIAGITAFAVAWNTGGGSQNLFRIGAGGTNANMLRFMLGRRDNDHRLVGRRVDDESFQQLIGGQRLLEQWGLDAGYVDFVNARAALFIDGLKVAVSESFLDSGTTSPTASQMFRIGSDHATQFWQGDIAEILIYDRVLSDWERWQVEEYLARKYNLWEVPRPVPVRIARAVEIEFESSKEGSYQVMLSEDGNDWVEWFLSPVSGTGETMRVRLPEGPLTNSIRVVESLTRTHQPVAGVNPQVPVLDGLRLQMDASAPETFALTGDRIEAWEDARGEGIAFVPPASGARPVLESEAVNGRLAVAFDTGLFLETTSPAALGMTNDLAGITAFAVGWNTGDGSQTYFRIGAGNGVNPLRFMMGRRTSDHRLLWRRVDGAQFQQLAGGDRLHEEWGIDAGVVDFANARAGLFINGNEVGATEDFLDPGRTSPTDSLMFRIGVDHGDQFWRGRIAEILIYDRALSVAEKNAVGLYLSDKYAVPYTYTTVEEIPFGLLRGLTATINTGVGNRYRFEVSLDLAQWDPMGGEMTGDGFPTGLFTPYEGTERAFFRAARTSERDPGRKHVGVFFRDGDFAAWPANHGIWSWGNEILVGFQAARHQDGGGHTWDPSTSRHKFARSRDGGVTWTIEDAYEAGITAEATGHRLGDLAEEPVASPGGIDFTQPGFAFTFRRRTDSTGPSVFYYSYDRGRSWNGPYAFPDLGTAGVASRTDYLVDGPGKMTVFLTTAKSDGRTAWAACARTTDGGKTWEKLSRIGPEPEGQAFMPASVRLSQDRILTVLRQTGDRSEPEARKWLAAYLSHDNGTTWTWLNDPADNLGWNSNPPSLIRLMDGRLCLVYAVRGGATSGPPSRVVARLSDDEGISWSGEIVLRGNDGANRDMGYTRAVQRPDGKVVVVYYYNHALEPETPPYRYIAATIFDPSG